MNILVVDDERLMLRQLEKAVLSVCPQSTVSSFTSPFDALSFAEDTRVEIAFLDIEMPGMYGLDLARRLKDINGNTGIIFVTGYDKYAVEAFAIHASGYLLKPVTAEQIAREIEHLRVPLLGAKKSIHIQCFGNFEIFYKGKPLVFSRTKSKEILAYLIDRNGAGVSKKELASILWEDKPYTRSLQSNLHILLSVMINTLESVGAHDLIIKQRSLYAIDAAHCSCDYFDYLKGNAAAVNAYYGEYMTNYSWAEFTTANLDRANRPS